ncbi:cupin-like domain-containing protein [Corallococcus exiguus]|uniref:cupin-like domain-containing protein n=1 Tax=Corallococcus TaxID=83461 RepID=UPI000ED48D25|nr:MULTISPECIES: cupin-like domain-containing protein [Corallococcus]NPC73514.1 cupin-like domain-containing protein [Corallococcus exiguus]RKI04149.1 cupin-like domain-containing protein [Corallococcus sp. AB038B]
MNEDTSQLRPEWRQWLAENLALGVTEEDVQKVLVSSGVDPAVAQAEVAAVGAHPYFRACRQVARHFGWMESLMDVYSALRTQDGGRALEVRQGVPPEEFFQRYYFGHRPVVLRGMMADWPALQRWSLTYFRERLGSVDVEVMMGRDADPEHAAFQDRHRSRMPFSDFLSLLETGTRTNDYYMVPRNENWREGGLSPLREDLRAPAGIIEPDLRHDMLTLLLGPAGTVTPLHHDNMNILLGQVMGRKHVRMVPSFERHRVYPHRGTFSHVNADVPDLTLHPLYAEATVLEAVLEPGDLVFLPVGWWHWVRALDVSASVTFHHFRVPGGNTHLEPPL